MPLSRRTRIYVRWNVYGLMKSELLIFDLRIRDRGAIFGLRGPNAKLPRGGKEAGATIESPFLLRSFSTFSRFFNFFSFLLKLISFAVATCSCSCLLPGFFRSLFVNNGKIYVLFRRQSFCLLLRDVRVRFPKITAKMLIRCS